MLIAISAYIKPLEQVNQHRNDHLAYLKDLFAQNKLLAAGRQNPTTGAVIIANQISHTEFRTLLNADPYTKANVAEYQIIEFNPVLYTEEFKTLLS